MKLILSFLFIAFFIQVAQCSSESDMQIQLKNLRESLYQAENIPGQKGLDQVKYYQKLIEEKEQELLNKGLEPEPEDKENVPWMHTDDAEKVNYQSQQQTSVANKTALTDIEKEILNVEEKLNWLIQNREAGILNTAEVAQQINQLADQRESLLLSKQQMLNDPSATIVHYKAKAKAQELDRDQKQKDPMYINILNEQLQSIFNQIYLLREQILTESDGEKIKKLGNQVSALEQQEKDLKSRIRAMGQQPLPPRIMSKSQQKDLKKESNQNIEYNSKLQIFIKELNQKVAKLRDKLARASSGAEISNLGQQLTILNQQIVLAQEDLRELHESDKKIKPQSAKALNQKVELQDTNNQTQKINNNLNITDKISAQQRQTLWSENHATPIRASYSQIKNATPNNVAIAQNVEAQSKAETEKIKVLENINGI
ncbi:MAG: hypothetical protein CMO49_01380 [Verrucomicrobiales bacterium]|nr:hypothetical protein [Verrucomicrobiales bacterium]|tara:strand:+ start:1779 stop:3062 length:1284 start_codon:yes stop_codon:yes gene_type:complete